VCIFLHIYIIAVFSVYSNSSSYKNLSATASNASYGQVVNQSIVQQLTNDGKFLILSLIELPIGLIASTICKCYLIFSTK
jgi:hypothetical protein